MTSPAEPILQPSFDGRDTLTCTNAPVAAAFDSLLQAPNGALLIVGWMLDPMRRVERVLVRSTAGLDAPIDGTWCALPRPDVSRGLAADPRFSGLLDDQDILPGFIVYAPARRDQTDGAQLYLEIVLDDETSLFRPMTLTPFGSAERLPKVLWALSADDPHLDRIVEDHLAPFLASVLPAARGLRGAGGTRPIALGQRSGKGDITAILPFRALAELQPIFGLLAGTAEAARLELTLVTSRPVAVECLGALKDAFRFYGLQGRLVVTAEKETTAGRLDAGVEATGEALLLAWLPAALPKSSGWLAKLVDQVDALPDFGLLSPALIYEDGSICFGGERRDQLAATGACARSGFHGRSLPRGAPRRVSAGAQEIALVDRSALEAAGGFAGHHFSDAFCQVDLAARLRRTGRAAYYSGAVEFWMLDDARTAPPSPFVRVMRRVDAALLGGTGDTIP